MRSNKIVDFLQEVMTHLVNAQMLNSFIDKIHKACPTMIAGVIADKHGLPMASKIHPQMPVSEQLLSLEAVAEGRTIVNTKGLEKIVHSLSGDVKLMMLLQRSGSNVQRMRDLHEVILRENPI